MATGSIIMKNREGKNMHHRRRSIAAVLAVAASISSSHSIITSATEGNHIDLQPPHNNLRRRRASEFLPLQIEQPRIEIESNKSECKGSSLNPGESVIQNEFICHGQLRFGIDYRGRFILGFAANNTDTNNPETIAWRAKPTTLFVDVERPFKFIWLTFDGNILGFDAQGNEIYDSHYDNQNREQGKEDDSVLVLSDDCLVADSVQPGTLCARLTSQPKPGMPNGMITWGVKVYNDSMTDFEPPSSSPTVAPTLKPSQLITFPTFSPSEASSFATFNSSDSSLNSTSSSSSFGPSIRVTSSPSNNPSIAPSKSSSIEIGNQTTTKTIIYGYVWLDENRDGKMRREDERFSDFEVKFYECLDNGQVIAAGSVRTDVEGLYFIQLPFGEYRALFEMDQDEYGYSVGVQDSTGWTDCMSSSGTIIKSSVGLYLKDTTSDLPSTEATVDNVPDMPPMAEVLTDPLVQAKEENMAATEVKPVKLSSIAGFIYIDRNNDKTMDPDERGIAVKGHTIGDAIMKVSLIDCQPVDSALPPSITTDYVEFPGHYMFSNLTEGSYKLKFELIAVDPNADITSMYKFIDGTNTDYSSKETKCGKLGQGQDNDQGDVGVYAVPEIVSPRLDEVEALSALGDLEENVSKAKNSEGSPEGRVSGPNASGIIGGVVAACLLAAGAAIFVLRQRQQGSIRSLGQDSKERIENRVNLGSSIDGDMSTTSDGGSTLVDRPSTGRHAAEQKIDEHNSEDDSRGYYNDSDDDSHQDVIDYGPVVSNIIAQYSNQQQQQHRNHTESYSGYYSDQHNHYHQQHYQGQHYHHDPHEEASTYSKGSANSADPPAASYRDLSGQIERPVLHEDGDREGYEVQYEKHDEHSLLHSESDSSSEESDESDDVMPVSSTARLSLSEGPRSRSNPRDNRDTSSWKKQAIPENDTVEFNSHKIMRETTSTSQCVDDNKSVISSGSDQSSDPPGASYKDTPFDRRLPAPPARNTRGRSVPPPPPRKFPSPQQQRYVSPQQQRRMSPQQQRYVSPQQQRYSSPNPSYPR